MHGDDARRREKYLKTSAGNKAIKLMLLCHFALRAAVCRDGKAEGRTHA